MSTALDFYFDFSSPYGYFAAMQIDALAAKYGRRVDWHPILLGVVFKTTGASPLPTIPMKGPYVLHDLERTARFHKISYRFPTTFPISTHIAARVMLAIQNENGAERAIGFAKAIYQAYFVDNINISEVAAVLSIASSIGLDTAAIATTVNGKEIKDQLKNEVAVAMERGVFGSPFIIIDDEPFWGFDRFDQLEALLRASRLASDGAPT